MEHLISAYGRALFPNRFGRHDNTKLSGNSAGEQQPLGLAPGGLDLSLAAAIYHLVEDVEALLAATQRLAARWRTRPTPSPRSTPISCN